MIDYLFKKKKFYLVAIYEKLKKSMIIFIGNETYKLYIALEMINKKFNE